jgi:hypothetical protein|tara:strand:- start:3678 stop:3821 length:144 start_codon:yes stop_codon:yes gene_type:complete
MAWGMKATKGKEVIYSTSGKAELIRERAKTLRMVGWKANVYQVKKVK